MASKKLENQIKQQEILEKKTEELDLILAASGEEWVEDTQIGLPPYWKAIPGEDGNAVGNFWIGIPVFIDNQNPQFVRYVIQATHPLTCFRGPVADMQEVKVEEGDLFTISEYKGLEKLEEYIGFKVAAQVVEDSPLNPTAEIPVRNFYRWSLKVPKETMDQLKEIRGEQMKMLREEAQAGARERMIARQKAMREAREKRMLESNASTAPVPAE